MSYIIKPKAGSVPKKTRRGCGRGSGLGKTGGRGQKGQRARSGQNRPYVGFEGGQMPLYRRVPKRGFTHLGVQYEEVNVRSLNAFDNGATVTKEDLFKKGLINSTCALVKILGDGDFTKKITIEADKVTQGAKELIEKAGGSIKLIEG
jgi:large subunit ribosomal protein L15